MHRLSIGMIVVGILAVGCTGSPVGDPCIPESIPAPTTGRPGGGFDPREIYLETSSVQCRTRVCMVYQLEGNPEDVCGTPEATGACLEQQTINNQVFCSCRCGATAGGDPNTPLCDCGDGYVCSEADIVSTGGAGVEGRYCIPCIDGANDPRNLDSSIYDQCPTQ